MKATMTTEMKLKSFIKNQKKAIDNLQKKADNEISNELKKEHLDLRQMLIVMVNKLEFEVL